MSDSNPDQQAQTALDAFLAQNRGMISDKAIETASLQIPLLVDLFFRSHKMMIAFMLLTAKGLLIRMWDGEKDVEVSICGLTGQQSRRSLGKTAGSAWGSR